MKAEHTDTCHIADSSVKGRIKNLKLIGMAMCEAGHIDVINEAFDGKKTTWQSDTLDFLGGPCS